MSMMSPELVRAVDDDRRHRLLTDAEAWRVRRDLRTTRWTREPTRSPRGLLAGPIGALVRRGRRHDPKIARLTASWLELDDRTARELARAADELAVPPGTRLVPGRFSYLGLDDAPRGLVVTTGTPLVTITSSTTVLVLTTADLESILPEIRSRAVVRPDRDAPAHLLGGRRDRVVRRRNVAARACEPEGVRAVAGPTRG